MTVKVMRRSDLRVCAARSGLGLRTVIAIAEVVPTIDPAAVVREESPPSIGFDRRRTDFRTISNSHAARITILSPLVGYLIIFNENIVVYLRLAETFGGTSIMDTLVRSPDRCFRLPKLYTCAGMRRRYPGHKSDSPGNICEVYDIALEDHHRALCAAHAAGHLLNLINRKRDEIETARELAAEKRRKSRAWLIQQLRLEPDFSEMFRNA